MSRHLLSILSAVSILVMNAHASPSLYDIPLIDIKGETTSLEKYQGKALLIVNVASKCGFTKQYQGLEKLHQQFKDQGLVVLGFPCNQFGSQEPGTEEEIMEFCRLNFGVSFPMFSKVEVNGPNRHPLYEFLAGDSSPFPGKITWNFNKFLVGKDGSVLQRYGSKVAPLSEELTSDIRSVLSS